MPYRAPAAMPATARYGLTSPPGPRFSKRSDVGVCPTTRSAQVRLSVPHRTAVGANEPGWYRLYELTFGAYSRVNSRIVASIPAIACRISADISCPSPQTVAPLSLARSERGMWQAGAAPL